MEKIKDDIEGLALSVQCMVKDQRPYLSLKSLLGSRRRLKLLRKDRRMQKIPQPDPECVAEDIEIDLEVEEMPKPKDMLLHTLSVDEPPKPPVPFIYIDIRSNKEFVNI